MEIKKELLEQQKTSLEAQMDKVMADFNALKGALQVCDYLLNYLNKQEEVKQEVK